MKRAVALLLTVVICFSLSACGPSRTRQAENLKAMVPEVKQFVYDNELFMQTLLTIKDRICEFNEHDAIIYSYNVSKRENQAEFYTIGYTPDLEEELLLITEDERALISETILRISYIWASIHIGTDKIVIGYANSGNTALGLENPVYELEDPQLYYGPFHFTVAVNEDWCIGISNFT